MHCLSLEELDVNEIESKILNIDFVNSIHHMHVWSLEGEHNVFTAHIKIDDNSNLNDFIKVKSDVKNILKKYKFEHYTVEVEFNDENCDLDDN